MRNLTVHMQTTLDNRIANADGRFWEPFPWGEEEMAYVNAFFRKADTWVLGRVMYEAIVPWWDQVARGETPNDLPEITPATAEFAQLQSAMTKVVFSKTLPSDANCVIIRDNLADALFALKRQPGKDILLSCGPSALGSLASTPSLINAYLIVIHPAVLTAGPQMFENLSQDLALELVEAKVFDGGAVVLHYTVKAL